MENGRIWVETVPDPEPRSGEVLVKSVGCGICGSDLHAYRHTEEFVATSREAGGAFRLTTMNPVVLGHEFCAEIVDYGPGAQRRFPVGSLVCGIPVLPRGGAFEPIGYSEDVPGGFAEHFLLSERLMMPVPTGVPWQAAALTEPMAVGHHAINKARLDGEAVLVIGAGPVGLAVIANLKQRGIGPVVVAELSPGRRALAERLGADVVVDPAVGSPYATRELSTAQSLAIFECVGVPGMIGQIFLDAPRDAKIIVVGVCLQQDVSRPLIAINKELNVQYVLGYSVDEFSDTLNRIADGTLDVEAMITHRIGLEDLPGAFDDLGSPQSQGKVLVQPWG